MIKDTKTSIAMTGGAIIIFVLLCWALLPSIQTNDERIIEFKKCQDAGMRATTNLNNGNIICRPPN